LANIFGFNIVPNGIFIDTEGTIRMVKEGFSISKHEHVNAIEKLLGGEVDQVILNDVYYKGNLKITDLEKQFAETKYKLAMSYLHEGKRNEALKELDEAILLNPDNFLIRKQRWYIRYPDKFKNVIDIEWQQNQLELERDEEQKKRPDIKCGPEGCFIPGKSPEND
jgi:tetratricopeptide (TPR) repeat protein